MSERSFQSDICVVIGASHAGVNFAFALRREGWLGEIILYDTDPNLPYHRPPLSKAYLASFETPVFVGHSQNTPANRFYLGTNFLYQ